MASLLLQYQGSLFNFLGPQKSVMHYYSSCVNHLVPKDGGMVLEVSFYSFKYFSMTTGEVTNLLKEPS